MITIEEINGKKYTVVWHDDVQSFNGTMMAVHNGYVWHIGSKCVATLLPALPSQPKPEDARLLHLYAAHGVILHAKYEITRYKIRGELLGYNNTNYRFIINDTDLEEVLTPEITHANTFNGERVEIAIEE